MRELPFLSGQQNWRGWVRNGCCCPSQACMQQVVVSVNSDSSLSVFILSELLVENGDGENMEEPHADGAEHKVVLSSSFPVRTVDKAVLAQDTGGRILNCERVNEETQCGL